MGTVTVGGKFLTGDYKREIGSVLDLHSFVWMCNHRHTAVQKSLTVLKRTGGTQWTGPFLM